MESHIFVYGTLRKDALGTVGSPLTRGWTFVGYGHVQGELYDFGAYPGAVPSARSESRVRGELHRLPEPTATVALIDRYERCSPDDPPPHEYGRELVDVQLDDGERCMAWIYWYRPSPPPGRLLVSGDYIERVGLDDKR